jgi:hypothetical protein
MHQTMALNAFKQRRVFTESNHWTSQPLDCQESVVLPEFICPQLGKPELGKPGLDPEEALPSSVFKAGQVVSAVKLDRQVVESQ